MSGALQTLSVARGGQVLEGTPLFNLEHGYEKANREEAERKWRRLRPNLDDAKTGQRPTELHTIQAQLDQARAALVLSQKEIRATRCALKIGRRVETRLGSGKSARDQDQQHISQLESTLETARLGAREQQIVAAEASLKAQEPSLAAAQWSLSQKDQNSPKDGLVFDTLYREGDWVAAGKPVIVLCRLPTLKCEPSSRRRNSGCFIKVIRVSVSVDGCVPNHYEAGSATFPRNPNSRRRSSTSQDMREKLVFLVEISFDPKIAKRLHPGQPVDARFNW